MPPSRCSPTIYRAGSLLDSGNSLMWRVCRGGGYGPSFLPDRHVTGSYTLLIDGDRLCDLLKDYGLGVEVTLRQIEDVSVRPDFFKDFA
jgi:hypothetical protein